MSIPIDRPIVKQSNDHIIVYIVQTNYMQSFLLFYMINYLQTGDFLKINLSFDWED